MRTRATLACRRSLFHSPWHSDEPSRGGGRRRDRGGAQAGDTGGQPRPALRGARGKGGGCPAQGGAEPNGGTAVGLGGSPVERSAPRFAGFARRGRAR